MPQLPPELIEQVSEQVAGYIAAQRAHYFSRATPLSASQTSAMAAFFRADLLSSTKLFTLENQTIENPGFYPMLVGLGFSNLPDFSLMSAITFNDVVVSHVPFSDGLLFHELVHVEQYRQLGTARFAELYVRGFLTGGGYHGIPLEINAYELGARFESNPTESFRVEAEVASWILQARF